MPLLIEPAGDLEGSPVALGSWATEHRRDPDEWLHRDGAVLLRGFGIGSPEEFRMHGRKHIPRILRDGVVIGGEKGYRDAHWRGGFRAPRPAQCTPAGVNEVDAGASESAFGDYGIRRVVDDFMHSAVRHIGFENLDRIQGRFVTVTDGLSQHGAVLLKRFM
ncbi:MAG: hypothetical protein BMS9Abin01_0043 [Gammaproteobacteria bacterium]|nr:MAG: hypothetical protein BMS9Abin01_0043 [Gammaproteobacteria bacterium]